MLRAIMYPNPSSSSPSQCDDSSPKFSAVPDFIFCKGGMSYLDYSATDTDLDSITYHFDRSYNTPPNSPQAVPYRPGYASNNPTPDTNIDSNNVAAALDSLNGIMSFKISYNSPIINMYHVVVRADAWRSGQRIASVFRDYPIIAYPCPPLPNLISNSPPVVQAPFVKGPSISSFKDTVVAGNSILVNLSVSDADMIGTNFQDLNIELWGDRLSKNLNSAANCPDPNDTDCASFFAAPQYDTSRARYYYSSTASWNSFMSWQTNCDDLDSNKNAKTHIFYIRASDDFCPIPAHVIKTIEITVVPRITCRPFTTSIKEETVDFQQLVLYPNPSTGLVFIDGIDQSLDYQIFDIQGKLMKRGRLAANQNQLELPEAEGLYFVSLRDAEGNEKTFKLIKQ
jgi:hypothetical protein